MSENITPINFGASFSSDPVRKPRVVVIFFLGGGVAGRGWMRWWVVGNLMIRDIIIIYKWV